MRFAIAGIVAFGLAAVFLLGATSEQSVGTTEEDVYTGQTGGTTADVVVELPSGTATDVEVEVTIEHEGGPTTRVVKPGEPLHQTFTKITKIKCKKTKPIGQPAPVTVKVDITPINATTRRSAEWRTTETEPAIPFDQELAGPVHFAVHVDGAGTATVQALDGTTVVAEFTTDSTDDVSMSFVGTTIKILAGSGSGTLRYQTED